MFKWIHEYHRQWNHEGQKEEGEGGVPLFFFEKIDIIYSIDNLDIEAFFVV